MLDNQDKTGHLSWPKVSCNPTGSEMRLACPGKPRIACMLACFSPVTLLVLSEHEILLAPNSNYAKSGRKYAVLTSKKYFCSVFKKLDISRGTRNMEIGSLQLPNKLGPLFPQD